MSGQGGEREMGGAGSDSDSDPDPDPDPDPPIPIPIPIRHRLRLRFNANTTPKLKNARSQADGPVGVSQGPAQVGMSLLGTDRARAGRGTRSSRGS
jgi:hypothetical protein